MKEFNLTFAEAMECLRTNECWVQGEEFCRDTVLATKNTHVMVESFDNHAFRLKLTTTIMRQKFRKIHTKLEIFNEEN